jgi:hypothetical protein
MHDATKVYGGVEIQIHTFLTSTLHEGKGSSSSPGRFIPGKRMLWYPLDRRLGGPQSRSGRGGEEKNSQPLPGLQPPTDQPVTFRYTD